MPCPEKFTETIVKYKVDENIIEQINNGYEGIVSRTLKPIKAVDKLSAIQIFNPNINR
ncbi:MAG: hypothetical protein K0R90_1190 [Oscillospiraceae bacterium]|jgi:hypothetical protein|nr:hypothetical protein [Oscillospiraceae bacterium]